jgi:hypothetical protein
MWATYTNARLGCGSRRTYIERLNGAIPHNILAGRVGSQSRRCAADHHVVVDGYVLGPEHLALLGALVGVVLKHNASAGV